MSSNSRTNKVEHYDFSLVLEKIEDALKLIYRNKLFPKCDKGKLFLVPTTQDIANELGVDETIIAKAIMCDDSCKRYYNSDPDIWITVKYLIKLEYEFKYMKKDFPKSKLEALCDKRGYSIEQLNQLLSPWIISRGSYKFYLLKGAINKYYLNVEEEKERKELQKSETSVLKLTDIEYQENSLSDIIPTVYLSNVHLDKLSVAEIHKFEFFLGGKDLGPTIAIPNVNSEEIAHLNENGIIKVGTFCKGGEILVGNVRDKKLFELTAEEKLLREIFGEQCREVKNVSFYLPKNVSGVVQKVKVENNDRNITIYIKESFPLEIGDILESEKGALSVLYGGYDVLSADAYCNMDNFDNNTIKRTLFGSSKNVMTAISTGSYKRLYPWYAIDENKFSTNQKLSIAIIKKFINQGLFDVLQNLLLNTTSIETRQANYRELIIEGDIKRKTSYNEYIIDSLIAYFYAMGIKTELYSAEKAKNTCIEHIINSPNLSVRMVPLRDKDVDLLSSGECVNGCGFDEKNFTPIPNGLFDEKIFGTKNQYVCNCSSYTKSEYFNKGICPNCGSRIVSAYSKRMGHIKLEESQKNYIFPDEEFSKILVISPEYRNFFRNGEGVTVRPINTEYSHIIARNNRLKRIKEINADENIVSNEKNILNTQISNLYYSSTDYDRYQGVVCEIYDIVKSAFINVPINYSASARVIVNLELDDYTCRIPYRIAKELFKPYILNLLRKNGLSYSQKQGERDIANDKYKSEIVEYFNSGLISARMYILSSAEKGKILQLTPTVCDYNVIEVSKNNYINMCVDVGDTAKIFVISQNTKLESDVNLIKFSESDIKCFYDFLDHLSIEQVNNKTKKEQVRFWIQKINNDPSIVNSIGFRFITGRKIT